MIKNERQYRITKAQVAKLESELARIREDGDSELHPRLLRAQVEALESQVEDLMREIAEYDALRSGNIPSIPLESLSDIPQLLIQARIAKELTQEDLARDMNLKPQQIQNYEATGYSSASLARILAVARALDIDVHGGQADLWPESPAALNFDDDAWSRFPVREMWRRGWIDAAEKDVRSHPAELARRFVSFLGPSFEVSSVWRRGKHQRTESEDDAYSLLAWTIELIRRSEGLKDLAPYRPGAVNEEFIREVLSRSREQDGPVRARDLLRSRGIALVILRHLPGTHLDGGTTMTPDGRPVIGLTLRYDRLDSFWFTLLHELVHVWLHLSAEDPLFLDDLDIRNRDQIEDEADHHARELAVPRGLLRRDAAYVKRDVHSVRALAEKLGVHPAIVAGRIRHETRNFKALADLVGNRSVRLQFEDYE